MSRTVTVSNGREFFSIDSEDLADAAEDGFYRPLDRGQTIIYDSQYLFEVPIAGLDAAKQDGFRDLLEAERRLGQHAQKKIPERGVALASPAPPGASSTTDIPDAERLLEGLSQAERDAAQSRHLAEQELAETDGWRWYLLWLKRWIEARHTTLLNHLRGSGVSAAVHVALLLILASLLLNVEKEPVGIVFTATPSTERVVQEVVIEPTPLEITEPTEAVESEAPPETEVEMAEAVAAPDFLAAVSGDAIKPPAKPAGSGVKGRPTAKPAFFGRKVMAINYVFVIDNSNSMTGGRFETALNELMISVNQLTAKQRFYVIFYSDTAYPMFHPNPATQLVPATPKNKQLLAYWLQSVPLCLKTNGKQAIEAAFALRPDVIFVLGDGAFTDGASQYFAARPQNKIPLHTLGMEVKAKDAEDFMMLAKAHGGTYKDVGVAPGARELAKRNPRPRNSVRGPIWGINLKASPKLK